MVHSLNSMQVGAALLAATGVVFLPDGAQVAAPSVQTTAEVNSAPAPIADDGAALGYQAWLRRSHERVTDFAPDPMTPTF